MSKIFPRNIYLLNIFHASFSVEVAFSVLFLSWQVANKL